MSGTVALADLRARIRALELGETSVAAPVATLGAAAIDDVLPGGGLARGALHEIEVAPGAGREAALGAASGFAAVLLACFATECGRATDCGPATDRGPGADRGSGAAGRGPVLWCQRRIDLYAPGLAAFGLDPARLIVVRAPAPRQALWVLEEALRGHRLAAVLGEVDGIDLAASRRLQLAARAGTPCLLLRRGPAPGISAAVTRWRVGPAPGDAAQSGHGPPHNLGASRWRVELVRCRGGAARAWLVEWCHETHRFTMAAPLADRAEAPARFRQAV